MIVIVVIMPTVTVMIKFENHKYKYTSKTIILITTTIIIIITIIHNTNKNTENSQNNKNRATPRCGLIANATLAPTQLCYHRDSYVRVGDYCHSNNRAVISDMITLALTQPYDIVNRYASVARVVRLIRVVE